MKLMRKLALLLIAMGLLSMVGCFRYYRTPRVIVDTVRTRRCVGKRYTYPCRHPAGHVRKEVIRCRRFGRTIVRRRRWIVRDRRCRRHRYYRSRRYRRPPPDDPQGPPPQDVIP